MPSDPNNPEVLTSVRTDVEAATIVGALAARGISASTTGSYTAGFRAEAPGCVNVIVKYKDLDSARLALDEIEQDQPDADWSQVDVGEPDGWTVCTSMTSAPLIPTFRYHVRTLLVLILFASLTLTFWKNHPAAFWPSLYGVIMANALGILLALFVTYVLRIPRDGSLPWHPDEIRP